MCDTNFSSFNSLVYSSYQDLSRILLTTKMLNALETFQINFEHMKKVLKLHPSNPNNAGLLNVACMQGRQNMPPPISLGVVT